MLIMPNTRHSMSQTNKRKRTKRSITDSEVDNMPFKRKKNKTAKDKQWWTAMEDQRLRNAVDNCGAKNWKLISEIADVGKSDVQCLQRWTQVLRPGLKKGTWSKEEDKQLTELVMRVNGNGNIKALPWKKIEKEMGGRTAKQCRERWKLSLDPSINKAVWSKTEDEQLMNYQNKLGNSWSKIKDLLATNRTENAVKLRYKCLKKREEKYKRNIAHLQNQTVYQPLITPTPPVPEMKRCWSTLFLPFEPAKVKKEEPDLTLPLPRELSMSNINWIEPGFEMFEVKQEKKPYYNSLDIDRFDSKNCAFDEVLQMLSEDDSSDTSSV